MEMIGDYMENLIQSLEASLHKGFIDKQLNKSGRYKPKLLVNNLKKNENVYQHC